jgi:SRSO17 transposase
MDADTILRIRPMLTEYLHEFDGCMGRITNRSHLETYVSGQLGNLERKSVEPIADAAGVPPRTLQEFLSMLKWDEQAARDQVQRRVARRHSHPHSVGVIDETTYHKQGDKTACVQRQHCGSRGKLDNCVASVHLGYVADEFHTLLDGELFLPEKTWHENRVRCRAAGIPDDVVYRAKWKIAVGQVERALGNGVRFAWLTFDEGYGGKPPFLRALDGLGQNYVAELPSDFVGWTRPPEVLYREHARYQGTGRRRKLPRLKVRNTPAAEVREIRKHSPILRKARWERFRVKDGSKGPMVWEAKRIPFWIKDENGLPSRPHHLIVTRNVMKPDEVKFFLSNAPESTPLEVLLMVAFSRWHIERLFEDSKTELGMDHFEVRKYPSIVRHLILTCISHLFLAEFCLAQREKKSGPDHLPGADGHASSGSPLDPRRPVLATTGRSDCRAIGHNAGAQRRGGTFASEADETAFTRHWDTSEKHTHLQVAEVLAL